MTSWSPRFQPEILWPVALGLTHGQHLSVRSASGLLMPHPLNSYLSSHFHSHLQYRCPQHRRSQTCLLHLLWNRRFDTLDLHYFWLNYIETCSERYFWSMQPSQNACQSLGCYLGSATSYPFSSRCLEPGSLHLVGSSESPPTSGCSAASYFSHHYHQESQSADGLQL